MRIERIIWLVAVLIIAGAAFYGGQQFGSRAVAQQRTQASQDFFSERGGGPPGAQGGPGGQAGQGGQGSQQGGQGSQAGRGGVVGTVSAVGENSVTVTDRNGQAVTIQLTDGGTVHKQVDGSLSDIKQGDTIMATGTRNGDRFEATSIQIGGQFGGPANMPPGAAPAGQP